MQKLLDDIKFIDEIELESGWEIDTDSGFKPISYIYKTVEYEKWIIKTKNYELECADRHIVFNDNYQEVFVQDLKIGQKILTKTGPEEIISIENTHILENMYDISVEDENHRYYTNGILSHNTTTTVCFLLWFVLFHSDKRCAILANKGATSRQILGRVQLAYINLPKFIQQGIVDWAKSYFTLENGSSIMASATSSDSVRGESYSCIVIDEMAFVSSTQWAEFYRSTYPTISSGKETRMILISTFNGQNHFYDMWEDAIAGRSLFYPSRVDWWDVPGRDEQWKDDQLKNMSEEDFAQEYGNEPLGSGLTLFNSRCFSILNETQAKPIQSTYEIKIYEEPIYGHKYIISVDPADVGLDYSVISIIDVTNFPYKHVAIYRSNKVSHLMLPHIITELGYKYNTAQVIVESNDVGKVVLHLLNYDLEYPEVVSTRSGLKIQLGIRTTTKTKAVGCARLKDLVESRKLIIYDKTTIDEAKHFIIKGNSYAAEEPYHDDTIMSLVVFAYYANTSKFMIDYEHNFTEEMKAQYEKEVEEALCPLPIFASYQDDYTNDLPPGFLD